AQGVRHGGPIAAHRVGHVLLGEVELRDEPLVAARLVHRREIVALQVLDQREREHGAVVHLALHGRDLLPAERLAGAQPPLAGDQLEAASCRERVDHPAAAGPVTSDSWTAGRRTPADVTARAAGPLRASVDIITSVAYVLQL